MPLVFIERILLAVLAGLIILVIGTNPFGFDLEQRASILVALIACAILASTYFQRKAKRQTAQLKLLSVSGRVLLLASVGWFSVHTVILHNSRSTLDTTRSQPTGTVEQHTSGADSPAVNNAGGDVTINAGSASPQTRVPNKTKKHQHNKTDKK